MAGEQTSVSRLFSLLQVPWPGAIGCFCCWSKEPPPLLLLSRSERRSGAVTERGRRGAPPGLLLGSTALVGHQASQAGCAVRESCVNVFSMCERRANTRRRAVLTRPVCDVLPAPTTRCLRAPLKTSGPVSVQKCFFPLRKLVTSSSRPPLEYHGREDVTSLPIAAISTDIAEFFTAPGGGSRCLPPSAGASSGLSAPPARLYLWSVCDPPSGAACRLGRVQPVGDTTL